MDNKTINKLCKECNIEKDNFDFKSEWDSSLSSEENYNILKAKLDILYKPMTDKHAIDEAERKYQEELHRFEAKVKEKEAKAIAKVRKSSLDIDKYFKTTKDLIKACVKSKDIHSLILISTAGLGKSYTTIQTLNENGLKLGENYAMMTSYTTPLELYKFMYNNRDKTLVFDDLFKLFDNEISKGILMSALWGVGNMRTVEYNSSTGKLDVPNTFEFKGKCIFLTNNLPSNIEALKSRCFWHEIKLTWNERLSLCYEISKINKIPIEIIDFIRDNFDESMEINLRTPMKIHEFHKLYPNEWKELALTQFEQDEDISILLELEAKPISVDEKIKEFTKVTGKSRRTYFNIKKKLKDRQSAKVQCT